MRIFPASFCEARARRADHASPGAAFLRDFQRKTAISSQFDGALMPHLIVEHTANLGSVVSSATLRGLNAALLTSGQFEEQAIKSRAVVLEAFAIGTAEEGRAFLAARLCILSGRTAEQKRQMSEILLEALKRIALPQGLETQITVEVLDMDRASYGKALLPA
ncbi:5-carboxymethyl-2-hydroxymuconate Delta-isomerase [Xanthobacter sp. TB0139]|uniref:5-carboxymethyl-2-hydroxymuconate Delta-isomerase n=1 Tax=Xanthobacter sp. TB0139 TaxID=3459178 RepID=UPI004039F432